MPSRGRGTTATCRLCDGSGPLTDEDIVPMWARRQVLALTGQDGPAAPPRVKVRICRACNGRLGRVFENDAPTLIGPLVAGDAVTLTRRDQIRLGSWLTKCTLLGNFAGTKPHEWGHDIVRGLLLEMMQTGRPACYTSVRIGRHPLGEKADPAVPPRQLVPATTPRFAFFGVNAVGHLVYETVVGGTTDILEHVARTDGHYDELVRVWPPRPEPVSWPPPRPLDLQTIMRMREAWIAAQRPGTALPPPFAKGTMTLHLSQ